jgi:hypothetical protein
MQTAVCAINFDARRRLKQLPETVVFEHRELDGTYTTLGSVTGGWVSDEAVAETAGGASEEYQLLFVPQATLDDLVQNCTTVKIAETRYEKRAVDPAVGSPAVIRLRVQPITGYASY